MQEYSEDIIKKQVGRIIVDKRKSINMSQELLAEKLEINVRTLSNIENGHTFISAKTLSGLCKIFGLSPKVFFDIDNTDNATNRKLNELTDKLMTGSEDKINFYYDLISLVDSKYNG